MPRLADTAFSILDLVPIRDDGGPAEALQNSPVLARHAEMLSFTRFWVAEHHNIDGLACSATAVLIGYLAAATSQIRVGAGGIMLPNHAPLVVAEQFGTLATLYPRRIDLGLGRAPGTDPLTARALRRNRPDGDEDFAAGVEELQALLGPAQPDQRVVAMPGVGTEVPIWLLGSSPFSARLAAQKGLPYAFASHFAPRYLHESIRLYRRNFRPSPALDRPYVMLGVPLIAALTDEEAEFLATTPLQRALALIRGESPVLRPPVTSMAGLWQPHEQAAVGDILGLAVIGGPAKVRARLTVLLEQTGADELVFTCDLYEPADRLRSLEILAGLR